jgi:DNA mismatch endonuclease, patch repair protein
MKEDPETRSRIMRAVKGENTAPELIVRRLTFAMGYRYRLHRKDLPGKPDLVFPRRRRAIFVHGCFWHGHNCARGARMPKTHVEYWQQKIARNRVRDGANVAALESHDWRVATIWECELKDLERVKTRLKRFLE